jgi:hypothetical protein
MVRVTVLASDHLTTFCSRLHVLIYDVDLCVCIEDDEERATGQERVQYMVFTWLSRVQLMVYKLYAQNSTKKLLVEFYFAT